MRRIFCCLLLICLLFSLSACGSTPVPTDAPSPTPTEEPVTAQFALPRTAATLHPILGNDRTNLALAPLIWEGLFELDNQFVPRKVLCESYIVSGNGLVWTFVLRSDVTFSDGTPLTSAEAAQSLQLATRADSRFAARLSTVASITAPDADTLTVTLTIPNGNLPALLDIPIVKGESEEPLGTGPYVIHNQGEDTSLQRRSGWWRSLSLPFESIPLQTVEGADNLIYAFDTNDVSLVTTDLTGTNALGYSTGYETWDCPTTILLFVGFNTAEGPCKDVLVRQALSRSFDRATVATSLFARHAEAAVLPVSPASKLYDTALADEFDYSAQAASDLFQQAGYELSDGVLKKNRASLSLTFLVNSENYFKVSAAEYLAEELGKLGVSVDLQKLSWSDYEKNLRAGNFDLYLGETMLTADFDLTGLVARNGALNYGNYSSAGASALLSALQEANGETRAAAARALYRALEEEAPFAALCFKNASVLTQWGQVSGLSPTQSNAFYGLSEWVTGSVQ